MTSTPPSGASTSGVRTSFHVARKPACPVYSPNTRRLRDSVQQADIHSDLC